MTLDKEAQKNRLLDRLAGVEPLAGELSVTTAEYGEAVRRLVGLAQSDTSGSRAVAQVLLSLYNGHNWHMDLTDFGVLDYDYLQSALVVIRGRVLLRKEPESMIENGSAIFSELEKQWQHLHTSKRYLDD